MRRIPVVTLFLIFAVASPVLAADIIFTDTVTLTGQTAPTTDRLVVTSSDAPANFEIIQSLFANPVSGRRNDVFGWGYNGTGGRPKVLSEHSLFWTIETHYAPFVGGEAMEQHLSYSNPSGYSARIISMAINKNTNYIDFGIQADKIHFFDRNFTQLATISGGSFNLGQSNLQFPIIQNKNNANWLRQMNAAGTGTIGIAQVDNLDRLIISPGGTATVLGGPITNRIRFPNLAPGYACINANHELVSQTTPCLP